MSDTRRSYSPGALAPLICSTIQVFPFEERNGNGDMIHGKAIDIDVYAEFSLVGLQNQTLIISFTEIKIDDLITYDDCNICRVQPSSVNRYPNPCTKGFHWEVRL